MRAPRTQRLFEARAALAGDGGAREQVRVALRGRFSEWSSCYRPIGCRAGGGAPPRVVVEFTLREDGVPSQIRVAEVTEHVPVGDELQERSGDVNGVLARCLASVVERTRFETALTSPVRVRYPFEPDMACP